MTFQIGDTVQLKSGGPDMKVTWINDDLGMTRCTWRDDSNALQTAEFPAASLVGIVPDADTLATPLGVQEKQPQSYTFNVNALSGEMRAQLTVTHYLALICFCDLLFRSSLNSLAQQVLGMVIGTLLVWGGEKLWKKYAL